MSVVTRFAPSPTGALHLGGVRTAVFAWLFARQNPNGRFLLRIEDTDLERNSQASLDSILDGLQWLGLDWDGPVTFQSKRRPFYQEKIESLLQKGWLYFCQCSPERLAEVRESQLQKGLAPQYDGHCRLRNLEGNLERGLLRFRSPHEGLSCFEDKVHGTIQVAAHTLGDWVVWRQGGPTYNFSVVVDDAAFGVTHVIRGDDHLSNTHRQLALLQALGGERPIYAHLPMVLDERGMKLSKRFGAASLKDYANSGYLPEAMLNALARCGASFGASGNLEVLHRQELIQSFRLEKLSPSPACLNPSKMLWLNGQHMRRLEVKDLSQRLRPWLKEPHEPLEDWVALYRARSNTLQGLADAIEAAQNPPTKTQIDWPGAVESAKPWLRDLQNELESLSEWKAEILSQTLRNWAEQKGMEFKTLAPWVRCVLLKQTHSPDLSKVLALLGKEEVIRRFQGFLAL